VIVHDQHYTFFTVSVLLSGNNVRREGRLIGGEALILNPVLAHRRRAYSKGALI